jgi:D-alanyl-D-alanine carboxypeptidase
VDFITSTMGNHLTVAFANTPAFAWLSNNAYRFGFILRYPEGKENITGYTYEPWHYRFVGREAATDIHFGRITLEEYLAN